MSTRSLGEQIVAEARKLIGVKFFHTGRDEHGLDCAGLILACWHALGLTDWDFRQYAPGGNAERLQAGLTRFCTRVDRVSFDPATMTTAYEGPGVEQVLPGDVLLLRMGRQPIHAGLVTGEGTFIHALDEGLRQVVEVPLDEHWQKRVVSIWRWREQP